MRLRCPIALTFAVCVSPLLAQRAKPFAIRVVDAASGRGVPMVELRTTNHILFVTDSNGVAAVDEPALQKRGVFFHIRAHGYEYPNDRFGYRGFRCDVEPGGEHVVKLKRINVAERLYRITGAGIYRDSILVGAKVPIRKPLLNGGVTGQDSVVTAIYRGKLFWFWGDTNRHSYPLGNFAVSGATSRLPSDGGLAPSVGVDLAYFVNEQGFSRPMCKIKGPGPVWIFGLMVVEHEGKETLLGHYARIKTLGTRHEHGIVVYKPSAERFDKLREFPLESNLHPSGNPTRATDRDGDWFYFPNPYPAVRVRARYSDIVDPKCYEAFSCLVPGTNKVEKKDGRIVWGWQRGGRAVTARRLARLGAAAKRSWMGLRDVETGKPIIGHGGTVVWNQHRGKWVMIALQTFGRSMLGEVWFAEGDTVMGPWGYARRIVTHDRYSFYNVKHHAYFDEGGGRRIYFEGTYTAMFSGNAVKTPRYDYNQIMYRLDLDDPRLQLPVPIYEVAGEPRPLVGSEVGKRKLWPRVEYVPFWAKRNDAGYTLLPIDARQPGTAIVYAWEDGSGGRRLRLQGDGPGGAWSRLETPVGRAWTAPSSKPPLAY